jgi:hypothetical protein
MYKGWKIEDTARCPVAQQTFGPRPEFRAGKKTGLTLRHIPWDVRLLFSGVDGANATCDDIRFKLLPLRSSLIFVESHSPETTAAGVSVKRSFALLGGRQITNALGTTAPQP